MIHSELLSRLRRTSRNGRRALLVLGSLAVLLDAGAKYTSWRAATLAAERAAVQRDAPTLADASPRYAPYRFRLGATLPLDGMRVRCSDDEPAAEASQSSDESFDINCAASTTVKAVGDLPRAELLSWPNDSRYDRAVRF